MLYCTLKKKIFASEKVKGSKAKLSQIINMITVLLNVLNCHLFHVSIRKRTFLLF